MRRVNAIFRGTEECVIYDCFFYQNNLQHNRNKKKTRLDTNYFLPEIKAIGTSLVPGIARRFIRDGLRTLYLKSLGKLNIV